MLARPERLALVFVLLICGPATAEARRFDLPTGPLAAGIARIGALSGDSIVASDAALLAGQGPAIRVDGDTGKALSVLLRHSGARAVRAGPGVWRIVARTRPARPQVASAPQALEAQASILVTAAKLNLPLARYPATVTLIDGDELARFGATPDMAELSRIDPVLQSTHLGPGRDKLFLRGIADSSFNGSGAALVGLYFDDLRLIYDAPNPDLRLYDISRTEILEGPQGTLYGAGSLAGLVRVVPNAPLLDRSEGGMWIGGTSLAHGEEGGDVGGIINIPLVRDRAALRMVAYGALDGGYIDDTGRGAHNVNSTRTVGGRAALRVSLGGGWVLDTGGIAQDIHNRDAQYAESGLPRLSRSSGAAEPSYNLFRAGDIVLAGPVAGVELRSTTGMVGQSLGQTFLPDDNDAGDIYRQTDRIRMFSQEIRLSSPAGSTLQWVAGTSLLESERRQIRSSTLGATVRSLGTADTRVSDITSFGELTAHLSPRLSLTAGGRLSWVQLLGVATGAQVKELGTASPFRGGRHEHFAAPTLALSWSPRSSKLFYLRYSQGYRPGGQTASGVIERFNADRLYAFEGGFRLQLEAGLSAELSAMIGRWTSMQADVLGENGLPITHNIGDGVVRSLDARLRWAITKSFDARFAATLARGHVTGYDMDTGAVIRTPLPEIARDTVAATLDYHRAIGSRRLDLGLQANHVGRSVLGSGSVLSHIQQGDYWVAGAGGSLRAGATTWSLFVDNLLDSNANSFAFGVPSIRYEDGITTPLRPRTVRLGLRHDF